MRLFVAIELEEDVARRVMRLSEELQARVANRAQSARLTWVPRDRLHLTVRFIGDVDDERAEVIGARLTPPLEMPAFDLAFEGAGIFPPRGPARVIWTGIARGMQELVALERDVSLRLADCGIPTENRPFRPHLTLARVRDPKGLKAAGLFDGLDGPVATAAVRTITLFQSRLSPKGPQYRAMQSTTLRSST